MKKVLAVVAVLCVVFVAGTALAQPRRHDGPGRMPMPPHGERMQPFNGPEGMPPAFPAPCAPKHGHRGLNFSPDMPEEIRARVVEAAKLRIDLEAALAEKPINKDKALEVFAKLQKAENEIKTWRFTKKLERIEALRTQHDLNSRYRRPVPLEAPAEAPAPEDPAPQAPAE